jgi:hypothetical protein
VTKYAYAVATEYPTCPFVHVRASDPTEALPHWRVVGKVAMTDD